MANWGSRWQPKEISALKWPISFSLSLTDGRSQSQISIDRTDQKGFQSVVFVQICGRLLC